MSKNYIGKFESSIRASEFPDIIAMPEGVMVIKDYDKPSHMVWEWDYFMQCMESLRASRFLVSFIADRFNDVTSRGTPPGYVGIDIDMGGKGPLPQNAFQLVGAAADKAAYVAFGGI